RLVAELIPRNHLGAPAPKQLRHQALATTYTANQADDRLGLQIGSLRRMLHLDFSNGFLPFPNQQAAIWNLQSARLRRPASSAPPPHLPSKALPDADSFPAASSFLRTRAARRRSPPRAAPQKRVHRESVAACGREAAPAASGDKCLASPS